MTKPEEDSIEPTKMDDELGMTRKDQIVEIEDKGKMNAKEHLRSMEGDGTKAAKEVEDGDNTIDSVGKDLADVATFEDLLQAVVGRRGRWHLGFFLICCYAAFVGPMQTMSYQFLGATPKYWCHVDPLIQANWSTQQILDFAIPFNNATGNHAGCEMYVHNYTAAVAMGYDEAMTTLSPNPSSPTPCLRRDFDISTYESTVTIEWDLVCERRWLYSTTQASAQIGKLVGYVFLGYLLDVYGRRQVVLYCSLLAFLSAFGMVFMPNVWLFIIVKVIIMATMSGIYLGCFVNQMETCGAKDRSLVASLFVLPWALGYMVLPGIAYYIRSWRWLQAAVSLPTLPLITYYWLLPESPRWLILQGRYDNALKLLKSAAGMNGKVLPSDTHLLAAMERIKNQVVKGQSNMLHKVATVVTNRDLRRRTVTVFYCWFASALVYYGISLNATNLSTDVYLYIFLGGLLEVPSYVLLWPAIAFFGRVKSLFALYSACGLSILLVMIFMLFLPEAPVWITTALSLIGKMAITAAFHLIWLFTAELFPTSFRSLAVSASSTCARLGSISSPYINDLLGEVVVWAPSCVFGVLSLMAGGLSLLLPETLKKNMPEEGDFTDKRNKGGKINAAFALESNDQQQPHKNGVVDSELDRNTMHRNSDINGDSKVESGGEVADTNL